jgi:hypothetical protein
LVASRIGKIKGAKHKVLSSLIINSLNSFGVKYFDINLSQAAELESALYIFTLITKGQREESF